MKTSTAFRGSFKYSIFISPLLDVRTDTSSSVARRSNKRFHGHIENESYFIFIQESERDLRYRRKRTEKERKSQKETISYLLSMFRAFRNGFGAAIGRRRGSVVGTIFRRAFLRGRRRWRWMEKVFHAGSIFQIFVQPRMSKNFADAQTLNRIDAHHLANEIFH